MTFKQETVNIPSKYQNITYYGTISDQPCVITLRESSVEVTINGTPATTTLLAYHEHGGSMDPERIDVIVNDVQYEMQFSSTTRLLIYLSTNVSSTVGKVGVEMDITLDFDNEQGTVTLVPNPTGNPYAYGDTITVKVEANKGYEIVSVKFGTSTVTSSGEGVYSKAISKTSLTIYATFQATEPDEGDDDNNGSVGENPDVEIASKMCYTYTGTDTDGTEYEIVITEHSVSVTINGKLQTVTLENYDSVYSIIEITINGVDHTIEFNTTKTVYIQNKSGLKLKLTKQS